MQFRALNGFRDFYPPEMAVRRWIESAWHAASRTAGLQEWDGPLLESLDLFTEKSGDEIAAQLYCFDDKGGRAVALRGEMTPSLARMVAARAGGLPKPIKWYCVPQFFRYERPQRGRGREFFAWNVDVIGSGEPAADAEVIAIALDALRRLGLNSDDLCVRLSDRRLLRRLLQGIGVTEVEEPDALACIDKLARDRKAAERLEGLLGASRAAQITTWCEQFPRNEASELAPVLEACDELGVGDAIELDFKIVRGLAYYTGPVWEIFDRGAELRAVAGGGRYDRLIETMGGPDLPALGFGMGDMVLSELLQQKGLEPPPAPRVDAFVISVGPDMQGPARKVLARLREQGVPADGPYTTVKLAKALRLADQAGASRAILVGSDEWAEGEVLEKDLVTGKEQRKRFDDLS